LHIAKIFSPSTGAAATVSPATPPAISKTRPPYRFKNSASRPSRSNFAAYRSTTSASPSITIGTAQLITSSAN
jgi:hypothetical protein